MPSMLRTTAYDTICHEHIEFYSFEVVKNLLEASGMKVVDVEMNDINGGSFAVTASKAHASYAPNSAVIDWLLRQEAAMGLETPAPFREFERRIFDHRTQLLELIEALVGSGKKVLGYGASTKGNVLLQFCGITERLVPAIAEVNEDKFGCFTPGTEIPIVSEAEAAAMRPDYYLVFPGTSSTPSWNASGTSRSGRQVHLPPTGDRNCLAAGLGAPARSSREAVGMALYRRASRILKALVEARVHRHYTQTGEDVILRHLFDSVGIARPDYLDIGANDPVNGNNTYVFYRDGASGVCVEAHPDLARRIAELRPRDVCLNVAIGVGEETHVDVHIFDVSGLSTIVTAEAEQRETHGTHAVVRRVSVSALHDQRGDRCPLHDVSGASLVGHRGHGLRRPVLAR